MRRRLQGFHLLKHGACPAGSGAIARIVVLAFSHGSVLMSSCCLWVALYGLHIASNLLYGLYPNEWVYPAGYILIIASWVLAVGCICYALGMLARLRNLCSGWLWQALVTVVGPGLAAAWFWHEVLAGSGMFGPSFDTSLSVVLVCFNLLSLAGMCSSRMGC